MKKLIILFVILCLLPITFAVEQMELDEIRFYVNNERVYGIDEDGGDVNVKGGDTLELIIALDNQRDNLTQAKLKGVLENIDNDADIVKDITWYDVNPNDQKSRTISFAIPNSVLENDYDLELTIDYKYDNGTEYKWNFDWEVIVLKTDISDPTELADVVKNISITCEAVISKLSDSFNFIGLNNNLTSELSTCKDERGTYKAQADERERTLIQCNSDRDNYQQDFGECEEKKTQMISLSECKDKTDTEIEVVRKEEEKSRNNTFLTVGVIGLFVYWYFFKRKKNLSVHDKHYQEKVIA